MEDGRKGRIAVRLGFARSDAVIRRPWSGIGDGHRSGLGDDGLVEETAPSCKARGWIMASGASQILVHGEGLIEEQKCAQELSLVIQIHGRGSCRLCQSVREEGIDLGIDSPDVGIFVGPTGQVRCNINVAGTELQLCRVDHEYAS